VKLVCERQPGIQQEQTLLQLERPDDPQVAALGLTLAESKALVAGLQQAVHD
jgi:hypothetical protein